MSPKTTVFVVAAVVAVAVAAVEADTDDRSADGNVDDGDSEAAANEDGGDGADDDLVPPTLVARRASIGAVDFRLFAAAAAAEGDLGDVGDAVVLASVDDTKSSGGGRCGPVS